MVKEKYDFSNVCYTLGIVSIVMAFFQPIAGIVFGIIGLVLGKRQQTPISLRGKKFSIIGLVLSIIIAIIYVLVTFLAGDLMATGTFPIQ